MSWILVTHELKRWTSVVEQTSSGITRWHNITTWCWSYSNLKLGCGSYYIRVSGIDGGIFYCQRNRIEDWNSERSFNRTLCKVKRIMILGLNIVTFSGGGGGGGYRQCFTMRYSNPTISLFEKFPSCLKHTWPDSAALVFF